ncbi:MAG TPA: GyrI-like domain-containing protein [Chryseosolibacter sp.]
MEVKSVSPINFLYFRTKTKVSELFKFLSVGQELFKEAVSQNLPITGPVHWHYFGFMGDANQPFELEIALPVGEIPHEYDGKYHFKRTEPFKCVSLVHDGGWLDIPKSYGKAFEYINTHKLRPSAVNREVYINADFKNPEANITEIQIGIN